MAAFNYTFENIKPSDVAIVVLIQWFFDEITADSQYTTEYGKNT